MKKWKGAKVKGMSWLLMAFVFFQIGCQPSATTENASNSVASGPMRVVTDDLGRAVTIPTKIERVVSLAPSVTEMIFAAGGGDRLVGVTTFCNYPDEAKSIAKIGDTINPNMESIVALKPDVVFVSTASQIEAFIKVLEKNGIAVYVTNPTSLDDVFKDLIELGHIFGTDGEVADQVANLHRRVEAVKSTEIYESNQRVFVQVSREPLFTVGRDSFVTALLKTAGAVSATADIPSAYPKISPETAAALNPDVIILSDSEDNREVSDVFKKSKAVSKGRVYRISADLIARPGPRLVDALEQLAKVLHVHRS